MQIADGIEEITAWIFDSMRAVMIQGATSSADLVAWCEVDVNNLLVQVSMQLIANERPSPWQALLTAQSY